MTKTTDTLHVKIDPNRCVGNGRCAWVNPGVFQIDRETGKAFYEQEDLAESTPQAIFAAARACPTQAISIEQFGRRVFPQIVTPMPADLAGELNVQGYEPPQDANKG